MKKRPHFSVRAFFYKAFMKLFFGAFRGVCFGGFFLLLFLHDSFKFFAGNLFLFKENRSHGFEPVAVLGKDFSARS